MILQEILDLFGGMVRRFHEGIRLDMPPLREKQLLTLTENDIDLLNRILGDYSPYLHNRTTDDMLQPRAPEDILIDIERLKEWRKSYINRKYKKI